MGSAGDSLHCVITMSLAQVHHTCVRISLHTNKQHKDCAGLSILWGYEELMALCISKAISSARCVVAECRWNGLITLARERRGYLGAPNPELYLGLRIRDTICSAITSPLSRGKPHNRPVSGRYSCIQKSPVFPRAMDSRGLGFKKMVVETQRAKRGNVGGPWRAAWAREAASQSLVNYGVSPPHGQH